MFVSWFCGTRHKSPGVNNMTSGIAECLFLSWQQLWIAKLATVIDRYVEVKQT